MYSLIILRSEVFLLNVFLLCVFFSFLLFCHPGTIIAFFPSLSLFLLVFESYIIYFWFVYGYLYLIICNKNIWAHIFLRIPCSTRQLATINSYLLCYLMILFKNFRVLLMATSHIFPFKDMFKDICIVIYNHSISI